MLMWNSQRGKSLHFLIKQKQYTFSDCFFQPLTLLTIYNLAPSEEWSLVAQQRIAVKILRVKDSSSKKSGH